MTSGLLVTIIRERWITDFDMEVLMAKDTKERILAAALEQFSQNGYAGTKGTGKGSGHAVWIGDSRLWTIQPLK